MNTEQVLIVTVHPVCIVSSRVIFWQTEELGSPDIACKLIIANKTSSFTECTLDKENIYMHLFMRHKRITVGRILVMWGISLVKKHLFKKSFRIKMLLWWIWETHIMLLPLAMVLDKFMTAGRMFSGVNMHCSDHRLPGQKEIKISLYVFKSYHLAKIWYLKFTKKEILES